MRDLFPGDFRPTKEQFTRLWDEGLLVPDANVLLDPYRTSTDTANALLDILEAFHERVRIPYQFASEFARNRYELLVQHASIYRIKAEALDKLLGELRAQRGHPFLDEKYVLELESVRNALRAAGQRHRERIDDDPMLERILALANSRVGNAPDSSVLSKWQAEAQRRHAAKQPPGYKDDKKAEPDCWGDYFGWQQMIEIAKQEKKPLMFITGDAKEDWWWKSGGETIGPRRELMAEFARDAQVPFYMYSTNRFVELASKHLKRELPPRAVEELAEAREQAVASGEKAAVPLATPVGIGLVDGPPKADPLAEAKSQGPRKWEGDEQEKATPKAEVEDE